MSDNAAEPVIRPKLLAAVTVLTVAVNVTACPTVGGFGSLVSVTSLVAVPTLKLALLLLVVKCTVRDYVALSDTLPALLGVIEQRVAGKVIVHVSLTPSLISGQAFHSLVTT